MNAVIISTASAFSSSWFELGFSQLHESFWIIKKGNIPCREEQKGNKNQLEIEISLEVILNQKHSQKSSEIPYINQKLKFQNQTILILTNL